MDARRTPTWIVSDHLKDQFTDLLGDPGFRTLQSMAQYSLNPDRCQRTTVSGRTTTSASFHWP